MTRQDNLLPVSRANLFAKVAGLTVMLVGCAVLFGVKSTPDEGSVFYAVLPRVASINSEVLNGQAEGLIGW
jgi:hypothetical protein